MLLIGHFMLSATQMGGGPSHIRHTHHPLWLLPSGSDQGSRTGAAERTRPPIDLSLDCSKAGAIIKHRLRQCKR